MISLSYINDDINMHFLSSPVVSLENAFIEESNKIDASIDAYMIKYQSYMTEAEIMGELPEDKSLYLEAESSNIFKSIGDAVISFGKKIIEMIEKVIEKIRDLGFKNKKETDKLEILLKEHPELKNVAIEGWKNGDLKLNDVRSLKELNDAFDELVKLSKQQNTDPKSLRAKWEKAKKAYENNREKIEKTAKTVTAVTGAAIAIVAFKKNILDARSNASEAKKKVGANNDEVMRAIDDLKKFQGGKYANDALSNAQLLKNASAFVNGEYSKMVTGNETKIQKMQSSLNNFLHKYSDTDIDLKKAGADYKANKEVLAHQKERDEKIEDAIKIKKGQLKAQRADEKSHKKDEASKVYNTRMAQLSAQRKDSEKNKDKDLDNEQETAKRRAIGSEEGKLQHYRDNKSEIDSNRKDNVRNDTKARNDANDDWHKHNDDSDLEKMKKNFKTKKEFEAWREKNYPNKKNSGKNNP